jgi:hypothetical protein
METLDVLRIRPLPVAEAVSYDEASSLYDTRVGDFGTSLLRGDFFSTGCG